MLNIDLNSPRVSRNAAVLVPLAFGLWSVLLGADSNWDMRNYHLYNAFALLKGKLQIDFAPAGFQTFFNPLLDVPYYLAITHLPPRLVAFLMGTAHGLNFVLLLAICRRALPSLPDCDKHRVPLLLALAGCLTVNFLSELGSTMGDNMTALFFLSSIALILREMPRLQTETRISFAILISAGILMGMGTGLKLTNAVYAVALCLGFLALPVPTMLRLKTAFLFGIGVLLGIAATSGYWFLAMWQEFGNPLFPQFGSIFPNPLAATISVADTSWLPKGFWQQVLWPFIISADAKKVGQIAVHQVIWAVLYALMIAAAVGLMLRSRRATAPAQKMAWSTKYVIVVIAIGFVLWMKLFSIYRYLVPIELLAPLAVFILFEKLLPYSGGRRASMWVISGATLTVLLGGIKTWGHEGWASTAYTMQVPPLTDPARTTVLIASGEPMGWLAIDFPTEVAFAQIEGNFPKGPGFSARIDEMVNQRGGEVFAMFHGHYDLHAERAEKVRELVDGLGLTRHTTTCARLSWFVETFRIRAAVEMTVDKSIGNACRIDLHSKRTDLDPALQNRTEQEKAVRVLQSFGFMLRQQDCVTYTAGIGSSSARYQWCPVERTKSTLR